MSVRHNSRIILNIQESRYPQKHFTKEIQSTFNQVPTETTRTCQRHANTYQLPTRADRHSNYSKHSRIRSYWPNSISEVLPPNSKPNQLTNKHHRTEEQRLSNLLATISQLPACCVHLRGYSTMCPYRLRPRI